jgi:glycosyltransferase involved in cell wall biosynthesis
MNNSSGAAPVSFLLVCHSYPPVIGGSELEAQRICAALIRRGYRPTVVCAGGKPMPPLRDWIDPEGVNVRIYAGRWKGTLKDIVFALRVSGMLIRERRNYQFVYFLMQGLHLAAGLPTARLLGKPILMKIAGSGVVPLMAKSLSGRFELRWLRKWAYRVMILNDGMREEAMAAGFAPNHLHWMPNPIDTAHFAPIEETKRKELRSKLGIPPAAAVTIYCGRLAAGKGLSELIDAFAMVARQVPEALLLIVGDGPIRAELAMQATQLQLKDDKVRFAGQVDPTEVCNWLNVADVFALVSFSEGFPCALAEAMSTGLPCVVSDIPANRQLIDDGKQGFLTPAGDPGATSVAIARLLKDGSLRLRMREAARQRIVDNYTSDKVSDRYETLFRQMLSEVKPKA